MDKILSALVNQYLKSNVNYVIIVDYDVIIVDYDVIVVDYDVTVLKSNVYDVIVVGASKDRWVTSYGKFTCQLPSLSQCPSRGNQSNQYFTKLQDDNRKMKISFDKKSWFLNPMRILGFARVSR